MSGGKGFFRGRLWLLCMYNTNVDPDDRLAIPK